MRRTRSELWKTRLSARSAPAAVRARRWTEIRGKGTEEGAGRKIETMKRFGSVTAGMLILAALVAGIWAIALHSDWFKPKADDDEAAGEVIPIPTVRLRKIPQAHLHPYDH